jgi:hypothetical protein
MDMDQEPLMRNATVLLLVVGLWTATASTIPAQDLAAVTRPGANIQRTMRLLEDSKPEKRNTVRVLFYGQSITCQEWWKAVAADLRARYPQANLVIENRAIGGFSAARLVKVAEYDIYPQYPDLMIFHDYGCTDDGAYEAMLRRTRERTTAEILLITHHEIGNARNHEESQRIRQLAVKYHCGLVDMERHWREVLQKEHLEPKALLSSGPHLNARGNELYAGFVKAFLRRDPHVANEANRGTVTDIALGDAKHVKRNADGTIDVAFVGNRLDAIPTAFVDDSPMADLLIDGRKPSSFQEAYSLSRPSPTPFGWMPALLTVEHAQPLVVEDWTLSVTESTPDGKRIRYRVSGSVTGDDGEGSNAQRFTSKSGRVVIDGEGNWVIGGWLEYIGKNKNYKPREMPAGCKVGWRVVPHFCDVLAFAQGRCDGTDNALTLVQGISNGPHVLRITPWPGVSLKLQALRVYRPRPGEAAAKGK